MLVRDFCGESMGVDEDGYIQDPELWNDCVAETLAHDEEVDELTPEHWRIINYIRDYFLQFGISPMTRKLCKEKGCSIKRLYELFPSGPFRGARKIAGIPKMTGNV